MAEETFESITKTDTEIICNGCGDVFSRKITKEFYNLCTCQSTRLVYLKSKIHVSNMLTREDWWIPYYHLKTIS